MMARLLLATFLLATLPAALAEPPASSPDIQRRLGVLKKQLANLAHESSSQREKARLALIALSAGELPLLRQAVKESLPLSPAQLTPLYDIVTHVYLTGDRYPSSEDGFLGVRLPNNLRAEDQCLLAIPKGVVVVSRLAGFCAARAFNDGDVLLRIVGDPGIELTSADVLIASVSRHKAGQVLTFEVLRQGQIIEVPLTLDRRPNFNTDPFSDQEGAKVINNIDEFLNDRANRADTMWKTDFLPLLADTVAHG